MITSKNNKKLKDIRQLLDSPGKRKKSGMFAGEGERFISEVPDELIEEVYVSKSVAAGYGLEDFENSGTENREASEKNLIRELPLKKDIKCDDHRAVQNEQLIRKIVSSPLQIVSDECFRSLSDTVNPQGVLALIRQPYYSEDAFYEELLKRKAKAPSGGKSQAVILDDIRDPGNLGTIIRTAEAAGACVVMSPGCADVFNPKVVRSTMGSIFRVPFITGDPVSQICRLKECGYTVYAAALEDSVSLDDIAPDPDRVFIIGNEANGISPAVLKAADVKVRIPMQGQIESLNAAVSAAILMYR